MIACCSTLRRASPYQARKPFAPKCSGHVLIEVEGFALLLRLNDIALGLIAGAVAALAGAAIEAGVLFARFVSVGHAAGGSKFGVVAIIGALIGAIVGWVFGALTRSRRQRT